MTEMLERAARAACTQDARLHGWDVDRAWVAQQTRYYDLAYAVLLAVREPDETLSAAARSTEGWESMIDAILEGK